MSEEPRRINCSCEDGECVHQISLTDEERESIYLGMKELFPEIPEEELLEYIYGKAQKKTD